jgi:hypothetical protein
MAVKRDIQPGELSGAAPADERRKMQNTDGIAALARLVKYCETEASDLKLSFVAYCLSIAKDALAEEFEPEPEGDRRPAAE